MGLYIEDVNLDEWLKENARPVDLLAWVGIEGLPGEVLLCEFREPHRSVLICWTDDEVMRSFPRENDQRPRGYYFAKSEAVIENLGPSLVSAMKQDLAEGMSEGDLLFSSIPD